MAPRLKNTRAPAKYENQRTTVQAPTYHNYAHQLYTTRQSQVRAALRLYRRSPEPGAAWLRDRVRCSAEIWVSNRKGVAIVGRTGKSVFRIAALILCVSLVGCVGQPTAPDEPPLVSKPAPPPTPKPEIEPNRVVLFLSDDIPAYQTIATQIVERGGASEFRTVNLDGDPRISPENLADIKVFNPDKIVSIGLLAAKISRQFAETPMVFCQVFNYLDHDLLSPKSKGVKLLPPFRLQLDAWKELTPALQSIGLVIGPNQEALIAEAAEAAEGYGIDLASRVVSSDKEALYVFKRLTPSIQGFWLLPDNRILSPRVLKEMMSYGTAHGVQIVVFNSQLMNLGAVMTITSNDADVAEQVLKALYDVTDNGLFAGPQMMPLTTMQVEINPNVSHDPRSWASPKLVRSPNDE